MAKNTFESLEQGAIEVAEQKLKQFWNVVKAASDSVTVEPSADDFNRMAKEMVQNRDHSFQTPDGKTTSFKAVKAKAVDLLKDAPISQEQKNEYLNQLASDIPSSAQFAEIASVTEKTAGEYDNWMTKLQYGAKGFFKMVQEDGFLAAIGEFLSSLFSGDFSFGKIGQYGKEIAADDIKNDIQHRLTELSKTPEMQGVLNAETIEKIGAEAKAYVLHPDDKEAATTPETRLENVKTMSFEDMAKNGIEKMVDAKLGHGEFVPKFKQGIQDAIKENNQWTFEDVKENIALRNVSDKDIEKISDVIREPLKSLLTSQELDTSNPEKLKEQVAGLIKDRLKNDKTTGKWAIIQNQGGLDMVANSIADEVVKNKEMLANARSQMRFLKDLDTDKSGDLSLAEIAKIKELASQNVTADGKLTQNEIASMPEVLRKQFDELLKKTDNTQFVKKDTNGNVEIDFNATVASIPNNPSPPRGLRLG
jgi:hypothetical protein